MKKLALGLLVSSALAVAAPAQAQNVWFGASSGGVAVSVGSGPYYGDPYYYRGSYYGGPYYGAAYYGGPYYDGPYYGSTAAVTVDTGVYDSYAYAPAYDSYAYAPPMTTRRVVRRAPVVETYAAAPARRGCWVSTENTKGYGYYGSCGSAAIDVDEPTLGQAERNVRAIR